MILNTRSSNRNWVEPALAAVIIGGLIYSAWFLYNYSYLPPPFFFEPSDTYADWFNTAFWARNPGAYDVWRSVYPPLSFVLLRSIGIDRCYPDRRPYDFSAGLDARSCDWVGIVAIWVILAVNIALIWFSFRKIDPRTAVARTICVGLGFPMVDAVERGNLVILSFTFLILAFGPLVRSAKVRWLAIGLAINLKIYLIAAIFPLLFKRRWTWVECATLSVVIVYLLSYAAFGHGSVVELIDNIRSFSTYQPPQIMDMWYTSTYNTLLLLLSGDDVPMAMILGSALVDQLLIIIPLLQHGTQALIILAFAATWLRPEPVPRHRLVCLGIMLALVTSEAGGYTHVYFLLFVLMEPWRGFGRRWAIVACYVLALPLDVILDTAPEIQRDTYVGDAAVFINYHVTLGALLRPLIVQSVAVALSLVTISEVWADIRHQGWANRWRLRHDVPLLPWVKRPSPPQRV
ncbi:MAG: hypothetical protein C0476_10015 [Sphingomonas sp.]|nr:hypothetical protein [Sphingomonas sp.]